MYLVRDTEVDEAAFRERVDAFYDQNYVQDSNAAKADDVNLLMLLIDKITNDTDDDDNVFSVRTKSGADVSIEDRLASAQLVAGPSDSDANIGILLDLTMVVKSLDEDDTVYIGGYANETEQALMLYAAELAGLTVGNAPENFVIPDEIKAKVDAVWEHKQIELGIKEPAAEATADLGVGANATTNNDLGIITPAVT